MEMSDLPKAVSQYWDSLSNEEQGVVLATLKANMKPMLFTLRIPISQEATVKVLMYLSKHKIQPHEVKRVGSKIHFIFDKHSVRNDVLIGLQTL